MKLLAVAPSACPPALAEAVQGARCYSDVFQMKRPLVYHSECSVSIVTIKATGEQAVVKTYFKNRLVESTTQQVNLEIDIHSRLSHPHVLQFLLALEDSGQIYIVTEYAEGGELRDLLRCIDEESVRDRVARPLLEALHTLHAQGVVHRDVKPENVLVQSGSVKLADLGLAVRLNGGGAGAAGSSGGGGSDAVLQAGGTPLYTAPEVLSAAFSNGDMRLAVGPKNDIWAVGVVLIEAATGYHPFAPSTGPAGDPYSGGGGGGGGRHGAADTNTLFLIANHKSIHLPTHISPEFQDWLRLALAKDPSQRPGALELLSHPWMDKVFEYSSDTDAPQDVSSGSGTLTAATSAAALGCVGGGGDKTPYATPRKRTPMATPLALSRRTSATGCAAAPSTPSYAYGAADCCGGGGGGGGSYDDDMFVVNAAPVSMVMTAADCWEY